MPAEETEMVLEMIAQSDASSQSNEPPQEVRQIAEERWAARSERNWQKADELRDKLESMGWKVLDGKERFELEPI